MYKIIFRLHRPTARRINTMASKRKNEHTVGVYHNKKLYFSSVGILQEENSNAIPTESVEMENYTVSTVHHINHKENLNLINNCLTESNLYPKWTTIKRQFTAGQCD